MKISKQHQTQINGSNESTRSQLENFSVRLAVNVGATTITIGGATMLYAQNGLTILATSKGALQLYAKQSGTNIPPAPFDPNGPAYKTLIANFIKNVNIVYGEELWVDPKAPATQAAITGVWFMQGDASWDYDLCLLASNDANLVALALNNAAWGNVSSWTSLNDMPNDINGYCANAARNMAILVSFGSPVVPTKLNALSEPTASSGTYTFTPPQLGAATGPTTAIPANALQICVQQFESKSPSPSPISTWPWPPPPPPPPLIPFMPPCANLAITNAFRPVRKYNNAILLDTDDSHVAVANDTGGGVFVSVPSQYVGNPNELRFVGVISDINGTTQTGGDFDTDFKKLNPAELPKALEVMTPYLPWPTRNQVVTLITPMLMDWPLDWPPAPEGYFRITINQQALAKEFVANRLSSSNETNIVQALNDVFGNKGKATLSKYKSTNILHASSGVVGVSSATIFFLPNFDSGQQLLSVQLIAIGSHSTNDSYSINWVWPDYTTWYSAQVVARDAEIAGVSNPNSEQGKAKIAQINANYIKKFGTEELVNRKIYTLQK